MEDKENAISIDWKMALAKALELGVFISVAIIAPFFGNQLITGSIINAILFISATIMGVEYAILLCLIPSLISMYTGFLSLVLAPMIPFIMTGNVLLVLVYSSLKEKGFWMGATPAALVKFIFIWLLGMILANGILHGVAKNIILMIGWPQLATAISGAAIAFIFLKIIKKYNIN